MDDIVSKPNKVTRTRLNPDRRKELILQGSVTFFADYGFNAQMRELAKALGVSPALIFAYFKNKEILLEAVYDEVFGSRWSDDWITLISDAKIPLPERLIRFYRSYLAVIDDRNWIRISMRASLEGEDLVHRYLSEHLDGLLRLIAVQVRKFAGEKNIRSGPSQIEMERVWQLHSAAVYYLVRKHIHHSAILEDRDLFVSFIVNGFICGLKRKQRAA
jgi:AcrR family transcriptional regulator